MLIKKNKLLVSLGIILLSGIVMLSYVYPLTIGKTNILYTDFGKFYHSQQLFIHGKNIYSPVYLTQHNINFTVSPPVITKAKPIKKLRLGANLNPPFFTLISFPLAYLPYAHALFLWTFLSLLAGACAILCLQRKLDPDSLSLASCLFILIGFFCYLPNFVSLQFGQVSLLLLLPLVLAWQAARDKKVLMTGILLGFIASLKPFFGLFLVYFLIHKQWRGLLTFIATLVVCAISASIILNIESYLAYYHACQHITWAASSWNVSLYGILLRLIGGAESNAALFPLPGLITFIYPLLSILLLLIIIGFLRPTDQIESTQKTDLDFSMIIVGMLLLSPLGWFYYFPFLSIPVFILWNISKKAIYPIALPLCLATLILLSNTPIQLLNSDQITLHNRLTVFISASIYFLVLVGFMGLLFLVRHHLVQKLPLSFERIPSHLLLLIGIVVFLPALLDISKVSHSWLRYGTYYSKRYILVSHRD